MNQKNVGSKPESLTISNRFRCSLKNATKININEIATRYLQYIPHKLSYSFLIQARKFNKNITPHSEAKNC